MKHSTVNKFLAVAITVFLIAAGSDSLYAQLRLTKVYPLYGTNRMKVKWNTVAGAQEYQYQRRVNNNPFDTVWHSTALVDSVIDPNSITQVDMYHYRVRVKVGGAWADTSNVKKNKQSKEWPVYKKADCTTEQVDLQHGIGQPIGVGAANYFHEGWDIQGESAVGDDCVKAPLGGIVRSFGGVSPSVNVNIEVSIGGAARFIQFNHLMNLHPGLVVGETVAPGDSLGSIDNTVAGWSTLSQHTHCHFWTSYFNLTLTTQNPANIWDSNTYKDPQGTAPEVLDGNGDGQSLRFRKGPHMTTYFADDGKVYNKVDIVAEAVDKQSSDAPWQVPKVIGYFIEKYDGSSWVNAVKSSASPFTLIDFGTYYSYNSMRANPSQRGHVIADYTAGLKGTAPNTPATYSFNQWFTWIVTNTKGTTGDTLDIDSNQCWATNARNNVVEDNGYKAGYDTARVIEEAKFKDGRYRVNIRLKDFIQTKSPDFQEEVRVDNFQPYVKKVEIMSGELNYSAQWDWNAGTGQLKFTPYSGDKKACGKINIKITFSEAMKDVLVGIPSLSFNAVAKVVAGTDSMVWETEVPKEKTKDAAQGPHKIEIGGIDKNDNQLHGFTTKDPVPANDIPKRLINGSWSATPASTKDKVHEFKINKLDSLMKFTTLKDPKCKGSADGEITVAISGGKPPYTYEWSPSGGSGPTATGLKAGSYTVRITDANGCMGKKDTFITDPPGLTLSVSGGGVTFYRICDPPASITLSASAGGGKPPYTYNWPGGTLTVSSSGLYTATVTDKNGCTKSARAFVLFIPIICSRDPNDIVGPPGYGDGHYISINDVLPYTIRFENDPEFATAPAQKVTITHPLDDDVNLFSMRLSDFGFGDFVFKVPENKTSYSARLDVKDSLGVFVDVVAGIDVNKKEAFWIFESKDPTTGLEPSDPGLGFLLVNDSLHHGEGFVSYTIKPKNSSQTGDTIHAVAEIVFDINDPIKTPLVFNVIDALPPSSAVAALPPVTNIDSFTVSWSGADDSLGSGVAYYALYIAVNNGPFGFHQNYNPDSVTSILFKGEQGNTYQFYTLGTDHVGNKEAAKTQPDAGITIGSLTVLNPQSGTEFCTGDSLLISWTSSGIDQLGITYSPDSGATFYPVVSNVVDSLGEYRWLLPDSLFEGSNYFIKLSAGFFAETSPRFTVHSVDVLEITPGGSTEICSGDSVILTADAGFQSYSWSTGETTQSIAAKQSGTYTVSVFNFNGCKGSTSIDILVNPLPVIELGANLKLCEDDTIQIGIASRPGSFMWTPAAGLSNVSISNPLAYPDTTTTYYLTYTDTNSCSTIDSIVIEILPGPTPPVISYSGESEFCDGDSLLLDAGAGYTSYLWVTGATTQTIFAKQTGDYTVTVFNTEGCKATSLAVHITVNINPYPVITGSRKFCKNDSTVLDAGAGYTHYLWSTGDTLQSIAVKQAGSYSVTVTDTNGCAGSSKPAIVTEVTVTKPVVTAEGPTEICEGNTVVLDAGPGYDSYLWSNSQTTQKITVKTGGKYSVTVSLDPGCTASSDSVSVTVNPNPPVPVITRVVDTLTSTTALSYQWNKNSVPIPGATQQKYVVTSAGIYTVSIADEKGCKATSAPVNMSTGVYFEGTGNYLKIYPNPSYGKFIIEGTFVKAQLLSYEINNIVGANILTVDEGVVKGNYKKEINIEHLPAAIYLLKFRGDGSDIVLTIIKQ